ncbi:MAG: thioesterase family protein [Alistipes sp.]|nr:thioesterase family protein [Alistipes sp.]
METGRKYTSQTVVTESITAKSVGSGDLSVLATPAMVALMENAAMNAVAEALEPSQTTVGSEISTTHLRPTPEGAVVRATATLVAVEGRKLSFEVVAEDAQGIIGEGKHTRYIVDRERFMAKMVAQ